jgi:hypothetical protein
MEMRIKPYLRIENGFSEKMSMLNILLARVFACRGDALVDTTFMYKDAVRSGGSTSLCIHSQYFCLFGK